MHKRIINICMMIVIMMIHRILQAAPVKSLWRSGQSGEVLVVRVTVRVPWREAAEHGSICRIRELAPPSVGWTMRWKRSSAIAVMLSVDTNTLVPATIGTSLHRASPSRHVGIDTCVQPLHIGSWGEGQQTPSPWESAHSGKWGQLTPVEKWMKN